jgi:hypothetical protein
VSKNRSQFWTIYGAPTILAAVTCVGLLSGILGDGVWDTISWVGLGIPIAVLAWFVFRPRESRH